MSLGTNATTRSRTTAASTRAPLLLLLPLLCLPSTTMVWPLRFLLLCSLLRTPMLPRPLLLHSLVLPRPLLLRSLKLQLPLIQLLKPRHPIPLHQVHVLLSKRLLVQAFPAHPRSARTSKTRRPRPTENVATIAQHLYQKTFFVHASAMTRSLRGRKRSCSALFGSTGTHRAAQFWR